MCSLHFGLIFGVFLLLRDQSADLDPSVLSQEDPAFIIVHYGLRRELLLAQELLVSISKGLYFVEEVRSCPLFS